MRVAESNKRKSESDIDGRLNIECENETRFVCSDCGHTFFFLLVNIKRKIYCFDFISKYFLGGCNFLK